MDLKEVLLREVLGVVSQSIERHETIQEIEFRLSAVMDRFEICSQTTEIVPLEVEEAMKVLDMFMISKKVQGLSDKTLQYYFLTLKPFLMTVNKKVENIHANDIRFYIAKYKGNTSKANQDNILRVLRSFFAWCAAEEYVDKNPTLRIKKIKGEKKVRRPFTELEVEKLRNGARDLKERAMIDLMLSTGCRIGELEKMDRKDINGDEMVVYGKGSKERWVYLNAKALFSLGEYLKTRDDDNPALFVSDQKPHARLKISGFEIRLRKLGREIGVDNVHPHRFRHTAATMALNRGMPIEQVQQMLGHEQIATTLIYAKTAQESLKAAHKRYMV